MRDLDRPGALLAGLLLSRALWAGLLVSSPPARAQAPAQAIILASTTSVDNSGLLGRILPLFTAQTGIAVHVLAQGTGQALATAARGDADLVLVHDPEAEERFIAAGEGIERREVAWNDFVLVGPVADPAHVAGGHEAVAALRAIAAAGAPFVSRGDASGTDALEKRLWRAADISPSGGWYRDIGGGMGQALNAAEAMRAYTIADRGTWLSFGNKAGLTIVVQGDPRLLNRYDVIQLDPRRHPQVRQQAARRLADWLAGPAGQAAIGAYTLDGTPLFHPTPLPGCVRPADSSATGQAAAC
ncbi:MAG: substrate-binding domain-containing protein [Acidisphaera sp.]|nr:substrate-binding domain-containing protein [Acidisphaera sp.]